MYYNQITNTLFEACFVLEMVDLANTFEALDKRSLFRYNMTSTFDNLNEIVIMLLKYQYSNERSNFLALLTSVMATFNTYYFSDDSFAGISEEMMYPGFREQLGVLFQLNFHLSCKNSRSETIQSRFEKYKNYKIDQTAICRIWNRFQKIDANLSAKLRTPLLINYDYCEEHHVIDPTNLVDQLDNQFVHLNRKFAYSLNSKHVASYRSFVEVQVEVLNIYKQLGKFKDVTSLSSNNQFLHRNEGRWFDLKLISIKGGFLCCTILSERLKRAKILETFPNYDFNSEDYKEIKYLRGVAKIKSYLIFIYILRIIEIVTLPNVIEPALLLCMRKDLITWFGFAALSLLDNITSLDEEEIGVHTASKIDIFDYSLNDLENLILDDDLIDDIYYQNRLNFKEYKRLSELLMHVYRQTSNNKLFSSPFDYYVKSKVLTLVSYILLVFEEFKGNQKQITNANLYTVISKLVKERMRAFQSAKDNVKRDSLLRLVINFDDSDTSDTFDNQSYNTPKISKLKSNSIDRPIAQSSFLNDIQSNLDSIIHNQNNQKHDISANSGLISEQQISPMMNIPPESLDLSRLPPEELISMIRLFINDDRFTTYITQLGSEDRVI